MTERDLVALDAAAAPDRRDARRTLVPAGAARSRRATATALFAASLAPGVEERFRYLFEPPPPTRADFDAWLQSASATEDPRFYAVIDPATGRAEGRQALMRITPEHGVIEIGCILWGPKIARTRIATEALYPLRAPRLRRSRLSPLRVEVRFA